MESSNNPGSRRAMRATRPDTATTGRSLPARGHSASPRRNALALFAIATGVAFGQHASASTPVAALLAEALAHNPEIRAARHEQDAAEQRAAMAGALDDPMLEAGIVNAPVPFSLRRDDMTMKMLGLTQRLPYPGKRSLRQAVATADSESIAQAAAETAGRVRRDVSTAYSDLQLAQAAAQVTDRTRDLLRQLAAVASAQYALGRGSESDVLKAEAEVVRMRQESLRIEAQRAEQQNTLERLLGRAESGSAIEADAATLLPMPADAETLLRDASERRPQLRALDALAEKGERQVELARREYFPDFELRLGYGQRDRALDGTPRDDMITMTISVNLPIWRKSRLAPRVAEAQALQVQAIEIARAQRIETRTALQQQLVIEQTTRDSAMLYRSTLLPQLRATTESALHGYQLGRVDFLTVLDAQMREYATALNEAEAIAAHNRAIAEIRFMSGVPPQGASSPGALP